jgi:acetyl-CoA C-acetyltransferase
MSDVYLVPGLRTPFVKAGGLFANVSSLELSTPIIKAMSARARPDLLVWGQVIPDPGMSNIARELVFEAGLDATIPAYSTVMACSTSLMGALQAAGMVGKGGMRLALVGGVESMTHVPIALKYKVAERVVRALADRSKTLEQFAKLTPADFDLPVSGWANRVSGRTMGDHMEDTAKELGISRVDQDQRALFSHQGAIRGQDAGFFADLILPLAGVDHDTFPRRDTSLEKLAKLPPVFDRSGTGSLTAGNSSPLTDGAAALWLADRDGLRQLGVEPAVRLVDWQVDAVDFSIDGMLMAPARAIPKLLARHGLRAEQIDLWEIHEAFSAQVIANVRAASNPKYRQEKAGVEADTGTISVDRINPYGGSVALGHPFAATGARILSQATKELAAMHSSARAIVSVCADGGQGTVALLERI